MPKEPEITRRNAVEASVSRSKALGATSNLYIVEGETHAYVFAGEKGVDEGFDVSTRSPNGRTVVMYLKKSEYTIETLWPRLNVSAGWEKQPDGLWYKS